MKNRQGYFSTLLAVVILAACAPPAWSTYTNATYQFQLEYPSDGSLVTDTPMDARILLPFQSGTNLVESYLDIAVQEGAIPCLTPYGDPYSPPPGTLTIDEGLIGGEYFVVERASEGAAGSIYEWIAYSTRNATDCVSLTFVLHSTNQGLLTTPLPTYSWAVEEDRFLSIVRTFTWLAPTLTPHSSFTPTANVFKQLSTLTPTLKVLKQIPSFTPTPADLHFIPIYNAYCRLGPDQVFESKNLAMKGVSYLIDGRNYENSWLYIMLSPDLGCWVQQEAGTASGDTSLVRVLLEIPTPTIRLNCSQYSDYTSCSQHPECTWNRVVIPATCQNK